VADPDPVGVAGSVVMGAGLVESRARAGLMVHVAVRHPATAQAGPRRVRASLDARAEAVAAGRYRSLRDQVFAPPALLSETVARGRLGRKSGAGFHEYPERHVGAV
jgi:3-hydroxyacyl-CoA dehydrogenase